MLDSGSSVSATPASGSPASSPPASTLQGPAARSRAGHPLLVDRATLEAAFAARRELVPARFTLPSALPPAIALASVAGEIGILSGGTLVWRDAAVSASVELPAECDKDGTSVLCAGAPALGIVDRVLDLRAASGFRPPIVVLEPDAGLAAAWCVLAPAPALASGRLVVVSGPGLAQRYAAWRASELAAAAPTHVLPATRPKGLEPVDVAACLEQARSRVSRRVRRLRAQQARRALELDPVDVAWRARGARRGRAALRVLACTTRHGTVVPGATAALVGALRRAGCSVDLVTESAPHHAEVETFTPLAEVRYDVALTMNRLRGDLAGRLDARIPLVSWLQDHRIEHRTPHAGATTGPRDVVLAHAPRFLADYCGFPAEALLETTNLTDGSVYAPAPPGCRDASPRADIVYAGHGSATPESMIADSGAEKALATCLRTLLLSVRRALRSGVDLSPLVIAALLLEAERSSGLGPLAPRARAVELQPLAMQLVDRVLRHETLLWAAAWARSRGRTLRLHGRGWAEHPTLAPFAAGTVEPGTALRDVLRGAGLVLQVNGYGAMHQRLLDALACGTPVLTRYNPVDFLRAPYRRLAAAIQRHGIGSFGELDACAATDPALGALLDELRRLGAPLLAHRDPGRRPKEIEFLRAVGARPEGRDDEGAWLEAYATAAFAGRRVAADLPRFAETTFRDSSGLHALLDGLLLGPEAAARRSALAAPMREAVLRQDTMDALLPRILRRLRLRCGGR